MWNNGLVVAMIEPVIALGALKAEMGKVRRNGEGMLYGEILLECAFKGLTKVLGKGGAQAVALELQLGKNGMNPLEFHERLFPMFRGGTTVLERAIVQEFYERLGIQVKRKSPFIYEEYVNEAIALSNLPK